MPWQGMMSPVLFLTLPLFSVLSLLLFLQFPLASTRAVQERPSHKVYPKSPQMFIYPTSSSFAAELDGPTELFELPGIGFCEFPDSYRAVEPGEGFGPGYAFLPRNFCCCRRPRWVVQGASCRQSKRSALSHYQSIVLLSSVAVALRLRLTQTAAHCTQLRTRN